ncbi:zinc-type alcohol dehydrogenase-like protein YycR [Apiospora hydei]|uniref:Zinc-type alcohol dehydrogenase-like protein YycR n=1 Tax=Apiospora hydei TaxID=1337664 RepID=A0ABR1WAZ3_9PEZI
MSTTTTSTAAGGKGQNTYLTVRKIDGNPGKVYYPLQLHTAPIPAPGPGEVLVELHAAALNHRDLFIRQHLYPGISFAHPLLADGCGTVIGYGRGTESDFPSLLNRRVLLMPTRGWYQSRDGPEDLKKYTVIGGSQGDPAGAAQRYIALPAAEVEPLPAHLTSVEGAALPLVGVTAWRALVTKCFDGDLARAPGRNILVTGIGGGVALQLLQFGVALGCNVYVTSGDPAKLARATGPDLGAKGGVNYRDKDWDAQLGKLLPADRPYLDAVVDGAGGDLVARTVRLLKPGGVLACYGMTLSPNMNWSMGAVMKNVELRGSTMGSRAEFAAMVEFVRAHKVRPVVSRVIRSGGLEDLDAIDGLYEDMRQGKQFGKLVIEISPERGQNDSSVAAKL